MRHLHLLLILVVFISCEQGWKPGENPDPSLILREAQADFKAERYADALAKHIWFHDHALDYDPSMYGVRLSFALSYWKDLGEAYPPALKRMIAIRDNKMDLLATGKGNRNLFHDVVGLNRTLDDGSKTVDLFRTLDQEHQELASQCWGIAKKVIIQAKEYDLVRKYMVSLVSELDDMQEIYNRNVDMYGGESFGEEFKAFNEDHFVEETLTLIHLAMALDDTQSAQEIQAKALAILNDPRLAAVIPLEK